MEQQSLDIRRSSHSPGFDGEGDGPSTIVWNFPARETSPTSSPTVGSDAEHLQWVARQDPEKNSEVPSPPPSEKKTPQSESGTSSIRPVFMLDIEQFKQTVGQKEDLIVVLDQNGCPVRSPTGDVCSDQDAIGNEVPEAPVSNNSESLDPGGSGNESCLDIAAASDEDIDRNHSDVVKIVKTSHLPLVTIKNEFKCSTCGEMFTLENELELHKLKHLMKQGPDVTSFGEKLKALAAIASDAAEDSPEGPTDDDEGSGVILCSRCPDIFSSRQEYLTHCRVVHKFDPDGSSNTPEMPSAAAVEASRKNRENHSFPPFIPMSPNSLNNHNIPSPRASSPAKSPVRTVPQYRSPPTPSRKSLSKSLRMPNVCADCGYSFKTYIELKRHRAGNIVHPCPKCTKILPRKDHYLKHCKTFHGSDIAAGWNPENPLPLMRTTAPACNSMKKAMSAKKKSKGFLGFLPDGDSPPAVPSSESIPLSVANPNLEAAVFSLRRPVKPEADSKKISVLGTVQVEPTSENDSDIDVEGTSEQDDRAAMKADNTDMGLTIGAVTGHYWGHDPEDIMGSHSSDNSTNMSSDPSKSRRKTSKPRRYFGETFLNDMDDTNSSAGYNPNEAGGALSVPEKPGQPSLPIRSEKREASPLAAESWVHQESEDQAGKFNLRKFYSCEDCGQNFQSKQYYRSHRRDASVMCPQCKKILTRIGNYVNHCKTAHKDALDAGWDPLKPPPRKVKMLPICILQIKRRRNQGLKKSNLPYQAKEFLPASKPVTSAMTTPRENLTVFPTPEIRHIPHTPPSIKSEPMDTESKNHPISAMNRPLTMSHQSYRRPPTIVKTKRKYTRKAKFHSVLGPPFPTCEHCGKEFKKMEHLRRHSNIEKIVCPQCSKKIIRLDNYWTHCRAKHMSEMQAGWQPMNPPPKRIRAGPACQLPKFRMTKRQLAARQGIRKKLRKPSVGENGDGLSRFVPYEESKIEESPEQATREVSIKKEPTLTGKHDLQPRVVIEGCKCPACGIVLVSEELLKAHMAKHDVSDFGEKIDVSSKINQIVKARTKPPKKKKVPTATLR